MKFMLRLMVLYGAVAEIEACIKQLMAEQHGKRFYMFQIILVSTKFISTPEIQILFMQPPIKEEGMYGHIFRVALSPIFINQLMVENLFQYSPVVYPREIKEG